MRCAMPIGLAGEAKGETMGAGDNNAKVYNTDAAIQNVRLVVYEGCRDEPCSVDEEEAKWMPSESSNGERTYRDRKALLVLENEVFGDLQMTIRRNQPIDVCTTHVGMLVLLYEWLEEKSKESNLAMEIHVETSPKDASCIRIGPRKTQAEHTVMVVVDSYRYDMQNKPFVSYRILNNARNVTIIVARELLPPSFDETWDEVRESTGSFYEKLGDLFDQAYEQRHGEQGHDTCGLGARFGEFKPTSELRFAVDELRLVRYPSIFDGLKSRRIEHDKSGDDKVMDEHDGEVRVSLAEQIAIEAMSSVMAKCDKRGIRLLRELHIDDLRRNGGAVCGAKPTFGDFVEWKIDYHSRFDLSFVDKETGRLLLVIEVDGDPHRWQANRRELDDVQERDGKKDKCVRDIGGLVLKGNKRDAYDSSSDSFSNTTFTFIRLPTDGSTVHECRSCGGGSLSSGYVTIDELLKDRIRQKVSTSSCVIAPHRILTDLRLKEMDVRWEPYVGGMGSNHSPRTSSILQKLELIKRDRADQKRWVPTIRGRQLCGITLALYGKDLQAYCVFPDDLEDRIVEQWDTITKGLNTKG